MYSTSTYGTFADTPCITQGRHIRFDVEGKEWAMKPMNCPTYCLTFGGQIRSYRDLPIGYADFGVLHHTKLSGALTGLTRVRRLQQND